MKVDTDIFFVSGKVIPPLPLLVTEIVPPDPKMPLALMTPVIPLTVRLR